jgi:hypothetical protein
MWTLTNFPDYIDNGDDIDDSDDIADGDNIDNIFFSHRFVTKN